MEKQLQTYTNALATLTNFVNQVFITNIVSRKNTETEEPFKFFYTMLHKTNNNVDTCNLLFANYETKPHHVDSLIIILRSLITDCIIYRYLLEESKNGDEMENMRVNIKAIYFDHVRHTINNVKNVFPHIHEWNDKQINETVADIKSKRPEYFGPDGEPIVKKFPTSVMTILTKMAKKKPDKKEVFYIRSFYHFYDIYSKYEHPGEFSFRLIHQQYDENTTQRFADDIVYVITNLILPTMSSMLVLWNDLYSQNKDQYNDLYKKVHDAAVSFQRTWKDVDVNEPGNLSK